MNQTTFIHKRLKQARKTKKISVDQMVILLYDKGLSMTGQTLRNYEGGKSDPQVTDLIMMADVLGKPIDYFFD